MFCVSEIISFLSENWNSYFAGPRRRRRRRCCCCCLMYIVAASDLLWAALGVESMMKCSCRRCLRWRLTSRARSLHVAVVPPNDIPVCGIHNLIAFTWLPVGSSMHNALRSVTQRHKVACKWMTPVELGWSRSGRRDPDERHSDTSSWQFHASSVILLSCLAYNTSLSFPRCWWTLTEV